MQDSWQPSASLEALSQRDVLMQRLRRYFQDTESLEVQTPALSCAATTDPHIDSFLTQEADQSLWLHTSPEFPMKRLVAAYKTDCHQFANVFRHEESGRHHNREFVLLEWYRVGFHLRALMADALQVINQAAAVFQKPAYPLEVVSYQAAVKTLCGAFPHELTVEDIAAVFKARNRSFPTSLIEAAENAAAPASCARLDAALTLLIDEFVVREFSSDVITALVDYPVSQASLAKTRPHANGELVALRAELFLGSVELANGFEELTNAQEQQRRFQTDNDHRQVSGKPVLPIDDRLIQALSHGLPPCAGMAMGIDRLHMVLGGYSALSDVMAFPGAHA